MMAVSSGSFNLAEQIWQRFIAKADQNLDGGLNREELGALNGESQALSPIDQIIEKLDRNEDGKIEQNELTAQPYHDQIIRPLIDIQESATDDPEKLVAEAEEDVARLFERADVDKDGRLSREEWDAETRLNKTRFLSGDSQPNGTVFFIAPHAQRDNLAPEDILAGRRITGLKLIDYSKMPEDLQSRLDKMQELQEQLKTRPDYQAPPTAEERRAEMIAEVIEAPFTTAYMSRLFTQLVDAVD